MQLSMELNAEFQEKGRADCPVCGTRFEFGHAPKLFSAEGIGQILSKQELDSADRKRKRAQQASSDADKDFEGKRSRFEGDRARLLEDAAKLLPEVKDWNSLKDSELPRKAAQQLQASAQNTEAELERAQREAARFRTLTDAIGKAEKEKETLEAEQHALELRHTELKNALEQKHSDMRRIREALRQDGLEELTDESMALLRAEQCVKQAEKLETENEEADRRVRSADDQLNELRGRLKSGREELQKEETNVSEAQTSYGVALREAKFDNEASYLNALERCGDTEGELWIRREEDKIRRYEDELRDETSAIRELEKNKPVYTDIAPLEAQRTKLQDEARKLDAEEKQLISGYNGHARALNIARRNRLEAQRIRRAHDRVRKLSEIANGTSTEGGKRAFDGYVLSSTFDELLEHASVYLNLMSGGKFELLHDTRGGLRKNSQADFRIQLQDTLTGQVREIGSLSGGESFQAAMALALGLSDTVRAHVSTVEIETMFIDEGFGTLDSDSLKRMLDVLTGLSNGKRQIAIISHVDALEECTDKFIRVTESRDSRGSTLKQIVGR